LTIGGFQSNKPKPEMVCRDPKGKKFQEHIFVVEYPFRACKNCGKHSPKCTCHQCKGTDVN